MNSPKAKNGNFTAEWLRAQFHYDTETGLFTSVGQHRRWAGGRVVGSLSRGYVRIKLLDRYFFAHRLAWLYVTGEWPRGEVDHIDGVRNNNEWANLRDVDVHINAQNIHVAPRNKIHSKLLGALWCKRGKQWKSQIRVGGKSVFLGCFDNEQLAHEAYIEAKRRVHKGSTL